MCMRIKNAGRRPPAISFVHFVLAASFRSRLIFTVVARTVSQHKFRVLLIRMFYSKNPNLNTQAGRLVFSIPFQTVASVSSYVGLKRRSFAADLPAPKIHVVFESVFSCFVPFLFPCSLSHSNWISFPDAWIINTKHTTWLARAATTTQTEYKLCPYLQDASFDNCKKKLVVSKQGLNKVSKVTSRLAERTCGLAQEPTDHQLTDQQLTPLHLEIKESRL